jgi:hypothetical protein
MLVLKFWLPHDWVDMHLHKNQGKNQSWVVFYFCEEHLVQFLKFKL